jgi:hypothetical protein
MVQMNEAQKDVPLHNPEKSVALENKCPKSKITHCTLRDIIQSFRDFLSNLNCTYGLQAQKGRMPIGNMEGIPQKMKRAFGKVYRRKLKTKVT